MFRMYSAACAAVIGFMISTSAIAAQIDFGTYVRDSATGLDWLKPSETAGISFDNRLTIPELSNGWRYATRSELQTLFEEFAPAVEFEIWANPNVANEASDFLAVFGTTYDDPPGSNWFDYVWAYIDEQYSATEYYTPWVGWEGETNTYGMFAVSSLDISYPSYGDSTMGHWLVTTSPVPVPSSISFMALGLAGLVWARRRRTAAQ